MKFILIIPVLLLFIGQVPFMKHMEKAMAERMEAQRKEKKPCCSKEESNDTACHAPEKKEAEKEDACCQKPEARCACVCCFSLAPITEASGIQKTYTSALKKQRTHTDDKLHCQYYPVLTPPPDYSL